MLSVMSLVNRGIEIYLQSKYIFLYTNLYQSLKDEFVKFQ